MRPNLPVACMHCDDAPCVKAAKDGAVYKRDDGIVLIDPQKAKGRHEIIRSCPYEVIWWNEEKDVPQKCTLCAHLLDEGWDRPRCVQACPIGALRIIHGDDPEIKQMVISENLESLHPQYRTLPRVYYKNLFRFTRCFAAGSMAYKKDGTIDCAEGAEVVLYQNAEKVAQISTDHFGDFQFDNLDEDSGQYMIEVAYKGAKKNIKVELGKSINIGTIVLE
ncbi:MAG: oxidoreductase [Deltaproteobacteria bacterium]|nr:oxidoreductase [Deltaproteobacteria bacterium]